MTTRADAENELISMLNDNMPTVPSNTFGITAGAIPESRVNYPNAPFTTPKKEVFLEVSTTFATGENIEASPTGLVRTDGVFVIIIKTPLNTGRNIPNNISDQLAIFFRQRRSNGVVIETNQVDTLGPVNAWYTKQINIFFYIEEN